MQLQAATSTGLRGSLVAIAALAAFVGVGGGAAALELRTVGAPVQTASAAAQVVQTRTAAPRADGFDPATCLDPAGSHTPVRTAGTEDQAAAHTVVSFTVPPMTSVTVDAHGSALAVATNTGQAPCVTDAFVAVGSDGAAVPASDDLRDAVLRLQLGDDWSPGVPRPVASS